MSNTVSYRYRNLPINGGGYVTGLLFSERQPDILYARTDIGGIYRYDYREARWRSLACAVGPDEIGLAYPLAIALADCESGEPKLYAACGGWHDDEGLLAVTEDGGDSFCAYPIPTPVHGNRPGRGTGSRLAVHESGRLYLASQSGGLLVSEDGGERWEALDTGDFSAGVKNETNLTFVWCGSGDNDSTIVIGTNGGANADQSAWKRGHSLYVSYDGGITFTKLPMPEFPKEAQARDAACMEALGRPKQGNEAYISGYVAQRYAYDGEWLYVTMSASGDSGFWGMDGYSCESSKPNAGRIVKYRFRDNYLREYADITPSAKIFKKILPKPKGLFAKSPVKLYEETYPFGFGGISACQTAPGLLAVSVMGGLFGTCVLRSADYGKSWKLVLHDLEIGSVAFHTPYMKPEYNGGRLLTHWLCDMKINPFRPNEAWFVTGTGVFMTENLLSEETVCWRDVCEGLEETVHMNVYALPIKHKPDTVTDDNSIYVVDAVGDLGAFVFRRCDTLCENTVADEKQERYITVLNADYPDRKTDILVMTPRGNWTGATKGGVIRSEDGGVSFSHLGYPSGLSETTDALAEAIRQPNCNSGWTAVSADGGTVLWSMAEQRLLPNDAVVRTEDNGATWTLCRVHQLPKQKNLRLTAAEAGRAAGKTPEHVRRFAWETEPRNPNLLKVMADRTDETLFYGFGDHFRIYISPDKGKNFYEYPVPAELPDINCGQVEGDDGPEIRAESGRRGVFWIAAKEGGLWRMEYNRERDSLTFQCVSQPGEVFYSIGLGIGAQVTERNYLSGGKTLYTAAKRQTGEGLKYGFWRSDDYGESWTLISNARQRFGQIRAMDGDCRVYGRYFIATGTMGILMGEEA